MSISLVGLATGTGWTADAAVDLAKAVTDWHYEDWNLPGAVCTLVTSLHWSADARAPLVWLLGGVILLLGSAWSLFRLRHGIVMTRASLVSSEPQPHHTLIMGLSTRDKSQVDATAEMESIPLADLILTPKDIDQRITKLRQSSTDTDHDLADTLDRAFPLIERNGRCQRQYHPWQQNLRMIRHHLYDADGTPQHSLVRVYIIPSLGKEPGVTEDPAAVFPKRVAAFKELLNQKLQDLDWNDITVEALPPPVDYENLEAVSSALNAAVSKARKGIPAGSSRLPPHQRRGICVDITAGQKIFSIAAASVTMNEDLMFGYVDQQGRPKFYDARIEVLGRFEG